jgi:uncharacterized Fe-S center protein
MAASVWFWNLRSTLKSPTRARLSRLLSRAGLAEVVSPGDITAVKMHFGEAGVTGHLQPLQVRPVIEAVRKAGGRPFLTDTATLYVGQRGDAVAHNLLAREHGFDPAVLGAPVIMADGLKSTHERTVPFAGEHIDQAHLAADILEADAMVVLSHVKGHVAAGFGGALKNLAMGCATRRGKMHQHCVMGPKLAAEKCVGCEQCVAICAPGALSLDADRRITLNVERCVGCGACFHACAKGALEVDWSLEHGRFIARMMEYASAVVAARGRAAMYVNFIHAVTPECDCMGFSDAPICPDIGVLASTDPVAVDQASLDLVNAAVPLYPSKLPKNLAPGDDKFLALNPKMPAGFGLAHAETHGAGSRDYVLREL